MLIWTLAFYAFLGTSFWGWGIAIGRILHIKSSSYSHYLAPIWIGWTTSLFILQIVHLFLPLKAFVALPLLILGIIFSILWLISYNRLGSLNLHLTKPELIPIVIFIIVTAWIALRSITQSPDHYDSGLYHFPAIKWSYTYPIVQGLANLHGRLGFNSSLFPFVAAINLYPIFNRGHHIANSFLLVLAFGSFLHNLRPVFNRPSLLLTSHPYRYIPDLFALPALTYIALSSELSSPTPDLTSTLLQLVVFVILCNWIGEWRDGILYRKFSFALIVSLAVTALTIKLSNLAFTITIAILVAYYCLRHLDRNLNYLVKLFALGMAIILLWSYRSYLLSGAPLYPSTIGYIPVKWAVPEASVIDEALSIFRWARPVTSEWNGLFSDWTWVKIWWFQRARDFVTFKYPIYFSLPFVFIAIILSRMRLESRDRLAEWSILSVPVVSLLYWFLTAPDLRFANALFILLGISSCLLLFHTLFSAVSFRIRIVMLVIVFSIGNAHFVQYSIANKWLLKPCAHVGTWLGCIPSAKWRPIPEAKLEMRTTLSGLQVLTPSESDQCWDAPLPCTPHLEPNLMLIGQGDLSSGFYLNKE